MKRRTDLPITPRKLIAQLLHAPLDAPWKTVRQERNSLLDYRQRLTSSNLSVAELYHENSKLFPQMLPELTVVRLPADEFRREVIGRRSAVVRANGASPLCLDPGWRDLISGVREVTALELFYAIELRILDGQLLALHEPASDTLQVIKQLSASDQGQLRRALRLTSTPEEPPHSGPLLFILGRFACNDVLFGPRGYRRTLLEAGQVAQELLHQARQRRLTVRPLYEFIDRDVDAVLEADGIEEGTVAVFELRGVGHVG